MEAHATSISEHTSHVIPGKLDTNKRFSNFTKGYMARTPITQPPLLSMTFSSQLLALAGDKSIM